MVADLLRLKKTNQPFNPALHSNEHDTKHVLDTNVVYQVYRGQLSTCKAVTYTAVHDLS